MGHSPHNVNAALLTWFHAVFEGKFVKSSINPEDKLELGIIFDDTFTVRDFLLRQHEILGFDNQMHVNNWELVHMSPFVYINNDHIFKIFDHALLMNQIPAEFLAHIQIHAVKTLPQTECFYLPGLVSNRDLSYFKTPMTTRVFLSTIVHPHGIPNNSKYYADQRGGHGLSNSTKPVYDKNNKYIGLEFSNSNATAAAGSALLQPWYVGHPFHA